MSEIKTITVGGTTYNIGGGLLPHLMIYTDTDITVTVTKGTTIITAEETSEGVYECNVPEYGTYTVSDTKSTLDVIVDAVTIYQITMTPPVPEGATVTPTDDIDTWIKCAGLENTNEYSTLAEVLEDTALFDTLLRDSNACDYMARSTTWAIAEGKVPTMTSNTTPSGTASASGVYSASYYAYYAFDKSESNIWISNSASNSWVQYEFDTSVIVRTVSILSFDGGDGYRVKNFKILASNDNFVSDTHELYTGVYQPVSGKQVFSFTNSTAYKYYRLLVTDIYSTNGYVSVVELQFYADADITTDEDAMARVGKYDYCKSMLMGNEDWSEAIAESPYILDFMGKGEVPVMTSNSTPSGICIASSVYNSNNYNAWMSFKNNVEQSSYISTGFWLPTDADSQTEEAFIAYQFASAKKINSIKIHGSYAYKTTGNSVVKNIKVIAKNDADSNYTELATIPITFEKKGDTSTFVVKDIILNFDNDTAYERYGVKICWDFSTSNAPIALQMYDIQMYSKKASTNIIHSAPNDTIYMIEDGSPVILATTNSDGIGELDWSDFEAGTYTLYSSVAKDPLNLSNDYSKSIVVTKTEYGGTTDAYLMPDAVKTLSWFGYISDNLEETSVSNGWTLGNYSFVNPTYNTNNISLNPTANATVSGMGTKNAVTSSKFHAIARQISHSGYGASQIRVQSSKNTTSGGITSADFTDTSGVTHYTATYTSQSVYLLAFAYYISLSQYDALWYE